jgi:ABC-type dipeptide/oligopeptide/nickel transport system permease component
MASLSTTAPRSAPPEMKFVLNRLGSAIFVIFGAVTLVFVVLYLLPGDPAVLVAGDGASPQMIANIQAELGTNKPLWVQYTHYLWALARGNLGTSFETNEPVASRIWAQFPPTLELTVCSCVIAIVLGVTLGVVSAVQQDRWLDRLIQTVVLFLTAMPSFWIGILLILVFSVALHWLPAMGSATVSQLILPSACLGLNVTGQLERMVRGSVIDVLHEPFVAALRGKGLKEFPILFGHVLRNALIPAITLLGVMIGQLLSGVVVIETLFARQGLGRLIVGALSVRDIPVLQGVVLFVSVFYVFLNFLIDLSYAWIDRRVRS